MAQYTTLFVAESHLSLAASSALAAWVNGGGSVFASAVAGLRDELNRTNSVMARLL